jgi:hypothetical protein
LETGERLSSEGPLAGLLVLDLSRVLAGPFCTMLLADLGARVVKVEHPDGGDVTRGWGPPWEPSTGLSSYYLAVNRNKESIALDLSSETGVESVRILARRSDVLVENFVPGGLAKLGLSFETLRSENPRLVTASITGFGRASEEAELPGRERERTGRRSSPRRFEVSVQSSPRRASRSWPRRSASRAGPLRSDFRRSSTRPARRSAASSGSRQTRSFRGASATRNL